VRLVSSGTEAAMTAVRVARGFTGRDRIVIFDGCYHGHSDALLAAGGSGMATLGIPGSAGVPRAAVADTTVVPYNVVPEVGDDVAAVLVEPVAANMGLVPPAPGFLDGLRAATTAAGALLVFDEVITGFRLGPGGAQGMFGITPDLSIFGKVIGGGLPLAALGGRADVMSVLAPEGPVYQAGTLSGNPLATAAGLAVLDHLDDTAYTRLAGRAAQLGGWLTDVLTEAGLPARVPVVGPLMGLFFADAAPVDYATAKSADARLYATFFHELLARGVALPPSPFEALFPSLAHTKDELERTADLAAAAAAAAAAATTTRAAR
jgi:glutamate-1-semialdehyde 2,1-aminomutase